MGSFRINLMGELQCVTEDGQTVNISLAKDQGVLAVLTLSENYTCTRNKLIDLLWSSRGEEQARASLRHSLWTLKKTLGYSGGTVFSTDRKAIKLNSDFVKTDLGEFDELIDSDICNDLEKAACLYRGELLEGLVIRDSEWNEWLTLERENLRSKMARILVNLIDRYSAESRPDELIAAGRKLVEIDPYREEGHRALMQGYAENDQKALALKQYGHCHDLLKRELGIEPTHETQAMLYQIKNGNFQIDRSTTFTGGAAYHAELSGPSVMVMPFDIREEAQNQQYLALGIAENIISALTRYRELFVIGIKSALAAKRRSLTVKQLGTDLGVQHVVAGSIHQSGDRLRVTVQLLDAINDRQIWAEKYDREVNDLFSIQDEIADLIVYTIVGHIEISGRESSAHKPVDDMQAYDHVLRGREFLSHWTKDGALQARAQFEKARECELDFAPAYAGLARSYMWEYWGDWASNPEKTLDQAFGYSSKAVELDASNHDAHMVLSMCYLYLRQYDSAIVHIEKCIALNPNDYGGFCDKGWLLALSGNPDEGVKCSTEGMRRNPYARGACLMNAGISHYAARRYRDAKRDFSETLSFPLWRLAGLAASYAQLGEIDSARQTTAELLRYAKRELAVNLGDDKERWLEYWQRVFPFKYEEDFEHLLEGLRKAGLPA